MAPRKLVKVDRDLVRRELGIQGPFEQPPRRPPTMFLLGVLVSWILLYGVIGEEASRQLLRSLGILR